MANLEQRDCKGLKELYCAKEDKPCPFYKPTNKYNRDGSRKEKNSNYVEDNEERW